MKRILTACSVIFILFALLASSPAQAASNSAGAVPEDSDCYSTKAGNWTDSGMWDCGTPGATNWIHVRHDVTVNTDVTVNSIEIHENGILRFTSTAQTITIDNNGFTNGATEPAGQFIAGNGTIKFTGSTQCVTAYAPVTFNNVEIDTTVDFYCDTTYTTPATVNGTLTINSGGSVSDPPNYANGSTLQYYRNSSTNVGYEWGTGTTGAGVPYHVQVSNNTALATADTNTRTVRGNLTIDTGSSLTLGNTSGLVVQGNWVNNGSFTANSSTVLFAGGKAQAISGSQTTFYNLQVESPSTGVTQLTFTTEPLVTNAFTPFPNGRTTANAANPITLIQALNFNGTATVNFLELTDGSSNVKYRGVTLEPVDQGPTYNDLDLGLTTVSIYLRRDGAEDLDSCMVGIEDELGDPMAHVLRCYDITPETGEQIPSPDYVNVTLWFLNYAENSPDGGYIWHYDEVAKEYDVSGITYGCDTPTSPTSSDTYCDPILDVKHLSPFTLAEEDGGTNPTAVELVDLSARPASVPLVAPILLGAAAFLTGGILAFRKLRRR